MLGLFVCLFYLVVVVWYFGVCCLLWWLVVCGLGLRLSLVVGLLWCLPLVLLCSSVSGSIAVRFWVDGLNCGLRLRCTCVTCLLFWIVWCFLLWLWLLGFGVAW